MAEGAQRIQDLIRELSLERGLHIVDFQSLPDGTNNALVRLMAEDGQSYIAKFYFRDERNRLEREFSFLSVLATQEWQEIPKPVYQSQSVYCGVYEWIEGTKKTAEQFTLKDIEALADFIAKVHGLDRAVIGRHLPDAFMATFSLDDSRKNILRRIERLRSDSGDDFHPEVISFLESECSIERVQEAMMCACAAIGEEMLHKMLPEEYKRISSYDFAPQNTLFRSDGSPVFHDFEYAGIDHPLRTIVDYLNHERNAGISKTLKEEFVRRYKNQAALPEEMWDWFEPMRRLGLIEWHLLHLNSMQPSKIKQLRFAKSSETFDERSYIERQIVKARASLMAMERPGDLFV